MSNICFWNKSSVLVCGKIYICEECKKEVKIEFQGGATPAFMGEDFISQKLNLNNGQKLSMKNLQPNKNPWRDGFYIIDVALCEKCFKRDDLKTVYESEVFEKDVLELYELREAVLEDVGEVASVIFETFVEELTVEKIYSFIGKPSDIGDKHLKPNKKKRLLRAYVRKNFGIIEENFFKKIWAQVKDLEVVLNYQEKRGAVLRELRGAPIQYTSRSTTETVFLVATPFPPLPSMRVPMEGSVAENFYYPDRFNLTNFVGGNLKINVNSLEGVISKRDRRNLIYSKVEDELLS